MDVFDWEQVATTCELRCLYACGCSNLHESTLYVWLEAFDGNISFWEPGGPVMDGVDGGGVWSIGVMVIFAGG